MEPVIGDKLICNMHRPDKPVFVVTFVSSEGQMWNVTRDSDGAIMYMHRRFFRLPIEGEV